MSAFAARKRVGGILAVLLFLGTVSGLAGSFMAIAFDGAGVPLSYLDGSPFTSFLVPGLILGVVVGGTQLAGALGLVGHRRWSLPAAAVAGFGMLIWIFVELAVINVFSFLQAIYFGLGVLELVLVFLLLQMMAGARPAPGPGSAPDDQ